MNRLAPSVVTSAVTNEMAQSVPLIVWLVVLSLTTLVFTTSSLVPATWSKTTLGLQLVWSLLFIQTFVLAHALFVPRLEIPDVLAIVLLELVGVVLVASTVWTWLVGFSVKRKSATTTTQDVVVSLVSLVTFAAKRTRERPPRRSTRA